MNSRMTILIAFAALAAGGSTTQAQRIYWTGDGGVRRAYLDGSNIELVVPGAGIALALDLVDAKIYFSVGSPSRIQRANLDGSNVENVVTSNVHAVRDIDLDLLNGKIYWIDIAASHGFPFDGVFRANLDDGSDVEEVLGYESESGLYGIAVDATEGYLYWTFSTSYFDAILRRSLSGPPTEQLITDGLSSPDGIVVDPGSGKLYWTDYWRGLISSANLDGSDPAPIVQNGVIPDLALDLGRDTVYWSDVRSSSIYTSNLDGSSVRRVLPYQSRSPYHLSLDHRLYFDCDADGFIDLPDHIALMSCLSGPGSGLEIDCLCADENGDRVVDLRDFSIFQRLLGAE